MRVERVVREEWIVSWRAACSCVRVMVLAGATALVAASGSARVSRADSLDIWTPGRQWLSVRAGYAKSGVKNAADGLVGVGFGYTRMGKGLWSLGGHAHFEVLGRYNQAAEIEIPLTFEVARHFGWKSVVRPYFGAGGGAFYYKTYRTGADVAQVRPGWFFVGGMNAPISNTSAIGMDLRMVFQGNASSRDPIFPNTDEDAVHWSIKLNYARVE
jgi:hypothetical protein